MRRIVLGTLTPNITAVKLFSLTTSIAGLAAQPILYEQADKLSGGKRMLKIFIFPAKIFVYYSQEELQ